MRTYEVMFLIDNETVRAGWNEAKAKVTASVKKHGGKVLSSRRWEERMLAYPIKGRRRGTYLLSYCEMEASAVAGLRRELDLSDSVLRYLILQAETVPAKELELTQVESSSDFVVPLPPSEDESESEEDSAESVTSAKARGDDSDDDSENDDSGDDDDDADGDVKESVVKREKREKDEKREKEGV